MRDMRQAVCWESRRSWSLLKAAGTWLWGRGHLCPRSCISSLPPRDDTGRWHVMYGPADTITGTAYTDGTSRIRQSWPEAVRAGW
eukprot:1226200-Pyramimonas_sp.AAC.1